MFEKILVTEELYSIREAACRMDLNAMVKLANHVLQGKYTKQCGDTAFDILNSIFDHPALNQNLHRACEVYEMCSKAETLLYKQGKVSHQDYVKYSCDYLQWMMKLMVNYPCRMWDFNLMSRSIKWVETMQRELQESPVS